MHAYFIYRTYHNSVVGSTFSPCTVMPCRKRTEVLINECLLVREFSIITFKKHVKICIRLEFKSAEETVCFITFYKGLYEPALDERNFVEAVKRVSEVIYVKSTHQDPCCRDLQNLEDPNGSFLRNNSVLAMETLATLEIRIQWRIKTSVFFAKCHSKVS